MLEAGTHNFIAAKYLPPWMTLKDPRNMTKGQILEFLAHIGEQEKGYGIKDGFRFYRYCNGTEMVPAEYPSDVDEPAEQAAGVRGNEQAAGVTRKKARATAKSRKGKKKELPPPNDFDSEVRQPDVANHGSPQPDAAGLASDSNIDPALLAADTVQPPWLR